MEDAGKEEDVDVCPGVNTNVAPNSNGSAAGVGGERESYLSWRGHGRVLVIEDEPAVARLTCIVLEQFGFSPDVVHCGQDGLSRLGLAESGYRLVLVDLTMPDMSGVDVLLKARSSGCDVPMVLTSGYPPADAEPRVHRSRFAGYLQKPYRMEAFVEVIRNALRDSQT